MEGERYVTEEMGGTGTRHGMGGKGEGKGGEGLQPPISIPGAATANTQFFTGRMQWCSQDSDQQDQDSEFQDQDFVAQDQDSGSRLKLNDKDVLIKKNKKIT